MNAETAGTNTRTERNRPPATHLSKIALRHATIATAAAAAVTTGIAAMANAADVSLEIDAKKVPLSAFAFWTVVAALLGVAICALTRTRRRFVAAGRNRFNRIPASRR